MMIELMQLIRIPNGDEMEMNCSEKSNTRMYCKLRNFTDQLNRCNTKYEDLN